MDAVTSETDIANSALNKMGAERILSLNDDSDRARLMKIMYPIKRNQLLRAHPWRFSTAYTQIAQIEKPAEIFEFDYAYQLPENCARVFKTNLPDLCEWTEIEGGLLVTNDSGDGGLKIKYGKVVTDVTKFDATFVEVLALLLASDTAFAITQSVQLAAELLVRYEKQLAEARSYSAQVGSIQRVHAEEWLDARY